MVIINMSSKMQDKSRISNLSVNHGHVHDTGVERVPAPGRALVRAAGGAVARAGHDEAGGRRDAALAAGVAVRRERARRARVGPIPLVVPVARHVRHARRHWLDHLLQQNK